MKDIFLTPAHIIIEESFYEAISPCNLQCNFCRKKYCRLQLGCQIICNEIIFHARRVFKNVSGILIMSYCDWFLLKKIARQVARWGCHTAWMGDHLALYSPVLILNLELTHVSRVVVVNSM